MPQDLSHTAPRCDAAYYREQAEACRAIAAMELNPTHRSTFLRLALHWRAVARAVDDLVAVRTHEVA